HRTSTRGSFPLGMERLPGRPDRPAPCHPRRNNCLLASQVPGRTDLPPPPYLPSLEPHYNRLTNLVKANLVKSRGCGKKTVSSSGVWATSEVFGDCGFGCDRVDYYQQPFGEE